MKRNILTIFSIITIICAGVPLLQADSKNVSVKLVAIENPELVIGGFDNTVKGAGAILYDSLKLDKLGLSSDAFECAYKGYKYLRAKGQLQNSNILTICDFSQSSFNKRMYIIDVKKIIVLLSTYVAHGKNTGLQYAKNFSNNPESLQSSLGFYVTKGTYSGKHGLSLKLEGKEPGFNNLAWQRAIVVHGADYIGEHRLHTAYMGRSFGCPAVPMKQASSVINTIKGGTCFFVYHPSPQYLKVSKILNS